MKPLTRDQLTELAKRLDASTITEPPAEPVSTVILSYGKNGSNAGIVRGQKTGKFYLIPSASSLLLQLT